MLLGRGPFVADDAGALFYQIIHQDPHPLTPRVPGLPADVEPVLRRALHKQPAGRFSSMRDFARAFEAAARHSSFKSAAAELGVTPTAISHQIRLLEQHCGQPLFRRQPRPLGLTLAGEQLFPVISLRKQCRILDDAATPV